MASAEKDHLEALPIAAAIISAHNADRLSIDSANQLFIRLAGRDGRPVSRRVLDVPFLQETLIAEAVRRFFDEEELEREFDCDDGRKVAARYFTVRLARLQATPSSGERCLLSLIDRTALVETERNLRAEMLRDSLTGLPNRIALDEKIEAILADPAFAENNHAVVVVDIERFSRINESAGAVAGDELIIAFARRLCSILCEGDIVARTGDDEFGILIKLEQDACDARKLVERIEAAVSHPFRLAPFEIKIDCSIGVALVTKDIKDGEDLLHHAHLALKRGKAAKRVGFYEASQSDSARRCMMIETELRRAIEAGDLKLAFQPLIDLPTGTISGFEALARWDHSELGSVPPTEFIPVAEESGLILPLGRWALQEAVETLARWDRKVGRQLPLYVCVNLSAIQIANDDVPAMVDRALRKTGLEGERLTLELTESAIVKDPLRAAQVLEALKRSNVRIAMDDFGRGYTSLAYLQRLPIDVLKIDRSFVTSLLGDRDSVAIVRAVLTLADALGMVTTAEGVESEELARVLTELGCTHGQGFFFARPLEADAALDYWLARNS